MTDSTETIIKPVASTWGLAAPAGTQGPIWDARGIMDKTYNWSTVAFTKAGQLRKKRPPQYNLSLVWDRMAMTGGTETERKALSKWIDKVGLPGLTKEVDRLNIYPRDNETAEFRKDGYVIRGNPRASYGYIYIVAYKEGNVS